MSTRVPQRGRDLERFLNLWRITIVVSLAGVMAWGRAARAGPGPEDWLGELVLGTYLLGAVALALYLAWFPWRRALGRFVVTCDVVVSYAFLVGCVVIGRAIVATNSQVFFFMYFFAVVSAGLRSDPVLIRRLSWFVPTSYASVVVLAMAWREVMYAPADPVYGSFRLDLQGARLIALLAVTWVIRYDVSLVAQDRAEALRDPLTGLYNRRFLRGFLTREIERATRYRQPLSLLLVDLDGFKTFNDLHGHLAGDQAIVQVATALRTAVRAHDIVARYGGDEFVVVLPNTTGEAARRIGRELSAALPGPIRFTAGVSCLGHGVDTVETLLDAADQELLKAKQGRR